jgi:spoIIIJ-associated protein
VSEGDVVVEATGETVGEAKWAALRELELRHPGIDKSAVHFEVVSEGERGLLGVGYEPARVLAKAPAESLDAAAVDESGLAAEARALVSRVTNALGVDGRVDVVEDDSTIVVTCSGADVALLIGRHGQTIDAVQTLANAMLGGEEGRKEVVVDAAGYRERRQRTLEGIAVRAAEEALRTHEPVPLEPMTAAERRLVHECLKEYGGVETVSEGDEPHRYVVVLVG